MNNKKNKKQRGGFIEDPMMMSMMIGLLVLVTLVCIYGGLVYFGGMDVNPMNWFNSEPTLVNTSETRMLRTDSDPPNVNMGTAEENFKPMVKPPYNKDVAGSPISGGKLFRRRK